MSKHINSIFAALIALGIPAICTSCSEDKYYNVDFSAVPEASAYADNLVVTVDQESNTAYFQFSGEGVYPVWIIDGKNYSTAMSFSRYYRKAGDYSIELKVANANGMSDGTITRTFHIDKTRMNGFAGFVYDSPFNLWTQANRSISSFFYAPGWAQLPDPSYSFDGDTFSVSLTDATSDQWQAQAHVATDICLPQGEHYDGSVIFTATQDINNVTLKIHPDGDDDDSHSFFMQQKINLTAGEPQAFFFSDLEAAVDMNNLVFTFDFGGNPAGIEIIAENIVIKKHSDDDGTVLPEISTEPEPAWVDWASADNLFYGAAINTTFYYAPGWAQIADPGFADDGDGGYTFTLPSATFERWQAQCALNTDIAIPDAAEQEYDFLCIVESNVDLAAVMFKLVETNYDDTDEGKRDNNFFFAEEKAVNAGTNRIWFSKVKAPDAMHAVSMFFDFGGNPDQTEVKVSKIILQKHHD
ncbi:MAG: hypothetical protein K2L83_07910 [Muribaculaceae bacterium]|nr:hypothetical protein [Muribaculaceae bacterium]